MALQGDLKSINLGNVLQDVASNALTGTLTLTMRGRRRVFWFDKGKLRLVGLENGKGPSPLNGLLALGKVKPSDINASGSNVRFLRGLVRKGDITHDDVKAALEHQMTEFVCDVFAWGEAHFEFTNGEPDEDAFETSQLDHDVRMAPDGVIMEALRRIDEWTEIRKVVFSPEEVLVLLRMVVAVRKGVDVVEHDGEELVIELRVVPGALAREVLEAAYHRSQRAVLFPDDRRRGWRHRPPPWLPPRYLRGAGPL